MAIRTRRMAVAVLAVLAATGCHRKEFLRNRSVAVEPPLASSEPDTVPPARVAIVERHPLFRKPVEYYESTDRGPVGKAAAATIIGVPAGILGEMRQVVVGRPPAR